MSIKKEAKLLGITRLSGAAVKALQLHQDNQLKEILKKAAIYQKHAGRKTMQEDDIKLAILSK